MVYYRKMYVCESCSKEYTSQKRYLSHIEHCERDDVRSVSTNASEYRPKSDKGLLEKLMADREKMKAELRQYKDELRRKNSHYNEDLEQSHKYYQEQIVSLTEEKEELADKLSCIREEIYTEKERLRAEFNEKLASEKKRIIASTKEQPTKLQAIIDRLQKKLDKQAEDFDELHENNQAAITLKDEQFKVQFTSMEQRFAREKDEFRKLIATCHSEKEAALATLQREKNHEIQQTLTDRNTVIISLENTIKDIRNQIEIREKEYKLSLAEITDTKNREMSEKMNTIKHLIDSHNSIIEKMQAKFDGRIENEELKYSRDIEKLINDHKSQISEIEKTHEISMENIKRDTQRQIQEYIDVLAVEKQRTETIEADINRQISQAETNYLEQIEQTKKYYQKELDRQKESLSRNHVESVRDRDDTILTLERLNHALGSQVGHFRSVIENMKVDTNRVKQQFIHNLNKQQTDTEKMLRERDTQITELKAEITHLYARNNQQNEETKAKFGNIMAEYTRLQQENKHLLTTKETLQKSVDDMDQRFSRQLELTKLEIAERNKNILVQTENTYKEKLQIADIKINEYATSIKQKDTEHNIRLLELRQDLQTAAQKEASLLKNEVDRYRTDYEIIKNEIATIKAEFSTRVTEANKLYKQTFMLEIEQLRLSVKRYKDDYERLNIDHEALKTQSTQRIADMENNYIKNVDILAQQLKQSKEETKAALYAVEQNKQDYASQMRMVTNLTNPEREHLNKLESELTEKSNNMFIMRGAMDELTGQVTELREQLRVSTEEFTQERKNMLKERDELLAQVKNSIRDGEVESKLKKMRDDCIESMRKSRAELSQMIRENNELKQKLSQQNGEKTNQ